LELTTAERQHGQSSKAAYTPFASFDENGNPTTISSATAIQTGATPAGRVNTQQVFTGRAGLENYKTALNTQKETINVLNDDTQRALVAQTLRSIGKNHDPGIISSFINSKIQDGLTPEAAQFIGATLQAREFIGANRQFAGNFRGSEALYNRMIANVASPQNNKQLNQQLIDQDLKSTDNIEKLLTFGKGKAAPTSKSKFDYKSLPIVK
jgi:hypothetical protein